MADEKNITALPLSEPSNTLSVTDKKLPAEKKSSPVQQTAKEDLCYYFSVFNSEYDIRQCIVFSPTADTEKLAIFDHLSKHFTVVDSNYEIDILQGFAEEKSITEKFLLEKQREDCINEAVFYHVNTSKVLPANLGLFYTKLMETIFETEKTPFEAMIVMLNCASPKK